MYVIVYVLLVMCDVIGYYFFIVGEILPVHVTVNPADKDADIVKMLWKLVSMKDKLEELSVEERNRANDLCQQLQAVLVGARVTDSILLFTHLSTTELLCLVREMFDSGQLIIVVRDLFRCLAKDDDLTVEVDISAKLFKECEDGFADDGTHVAVLSKRCYDCHICPI